MGSGCGLLAERLLPIPEVCGSKPTMGNIFTELLTVRKDENSEKVVGNGPLLIKKSKGYCFYFNRSLDIIQLQIVTTK